MEGQNGLNPKVSLEYDCAFPTPRMIRLYFIVRMRILLLSSAALLCYLVEILFLYNVQNALLITRYATALMLSLVSERIYTDSV